MNAPYPGVDGRTTPGGMTYPSTITATRPQAKPGGGAPAGHGASRCVADEDQRPCECVRLCVAILSADSPRYAWKGAEAPQQLLTLTVLQICHARQFSLLWVSFSLLTQLCPAVAMKSDWQQIHSGTQGRRPWQDCSDICNLPHEQENAGLLPGGPRCCQLLE